MYISLQLHVVTYIWTHFVGPFRRANANICTKSVRTHPILGILDGEVVVVGDSTLTAL